MKSEKRRSGPNSDHKYSILPVPGEEGSGGSMTRKDIESKKSINSKPRK